MQLELKYIYSWIFQRMIRGAEKHHPLRVQTAPLEDGWGRLLIDPFFTFASLFGHTYVDLQTYPRKRSWFNVPDLNHVHFVPYRIDKGNCGPQRNAWNVPCRSWTIKYWKRPVVGVGSFVAGDTRKREMQGNFFNARLCLAPLMFGKLTSFYSAATPKTSQSYDIFISRLFGWDRTGDSSEWNSKKHIELPGTRHFTFGAASSHLLSKDGTQESPDMTLAIIFIRRNSKHNLECINTIWL